MPTPGSNARGSRESLEQRAFETVEHWRIGNASFTGTRPSQDLKAPVKIERNSDEDDVPFASEEVEAARIMYDAFRAVKGPDGEVIDTERWSAETETRVEVRSQERHAPVPSPFAAFAIASRNPGSDSFHARAPRLTVFRPILAKP
jgi:hypothetical protein